MLDLTRPI